LGRRPFQAAAASASRSAVIRCSGAASDSRFGRGGRRYCGAATTRSKLAIGAQGRPTCTQRAGASPCARIQRTTGTLRLPPSMIRSGHGAVSALDCARSRLTSDAPITQFGRLWSPL
jgi:hypothetical protein